MCTRCYHQWHRKNNKDQYTERHKKWRDKNVDWLKEYSRNSNRSSPERYLYRTAKERAKKYGLEFSIDVADIVIPSNCPVLGIPLIPFSGKFAHNSPSIDRVDNDKGYVKGNILVVSFRANSLKKDATVDELQKLSNFYSKLKG